jgi:hypothetical protein
LAPAELAPGTMKATTTSATGITRLSLMLYLRDLIVRRSQRQREIYPRLSRCTSGWHLSLASWLVTPTPLADRGARGCRIAQIAALLKQEFGHRRRKRDGKCRASSWSAGWSNRRLRCGKSWLGKPASTAGFARVG